MEKGEFLKTANKIKISERMEYFRGKVEFLKFKDEEKLRKAQQPPCNENCISYLLFLERLLAYFFLLFPLSVSASHIITSREEGGAFLIFC